MTYSLTLTSISLVRISGCGGPPSLLASSTSGVRRRGRTCSICGGASWSRPLRCLCTAAVRVADWEPTHTRDMPDGVGEYRSTLFRWGGSDCTYIKSYVGTRAREDVNLLGDIATEEDVAWGKDSDDTFGGTGVRTSEPENLTETGLLADDHRAVPLGIWGRRFSRLPTTVHRHQKVLRPSPVVQRRALTGSTREDRAEGRNDKNVLSSKPLSAPDPPA